MTNRHATRLGRATRRYVRAHQLASKEQWRKAQEAAERDPSTTPLEALVGMDVLTEEQAEQVARSIETANRPKDEPPPEWLVYEARVLETEKGRPDWPRLHCALEVIGSAGVFVVVAVVFSLFVGFFGLRQVEPFPEAWLFSLFPAFFVLIVFFRWLHGTILTYRTGLAALRAPALLSFLVLALAVGLFLYETTPRFFAEVIPWWKSLHEQLGMPARPAFVAIGLLALAGILAQMVVVLRAAARLGHSRAADFTFRISILIVFISGMTLAIALQGNDVIAATLALIGAAIVFGLVATVHFAATDWLQSATGTSSTRKQRRTKKSTR